MVARKLGVSVSVLGKWRRKVGWDRKYNVIHDISIEELVSQVLRVTYFERLFQHGCVTDDGEFTPEAKKELMILMARHHKDYHDKPVGPYEDAHLTIPKTSSSAPQMPVRDWAPATLLREGWTTKDPAIGSKIEKLFESPDFPFAPTLYSGWIVAAVPAAGDDPKLYKVLYEDNDREDLNQDELDQLLVALPVPDDPSMIPRRR